MTKRGLRRSRRFRGTGVETYIASNCQVPSICQLFNTPFVKGGAKVQIILNKTIDVKEIFKVFTQGGEWLAEFQCCSLYKIGIFLHTHFHPGPVVSEKDR